MTSTDVKDFIAEYDKHKFPQQFLEKYEPIECLSQSELGETLLVKSIKTNDRYVCKCYNKDCHPVIEAESEILKEMSCAGIPAYIESFTIEGILYIVREYVEGQSLQKLLQRGKMSEKEAISTALQLCDILACLHGLNPPIIHRDIKPSNIIINEGKVYLIDFGISRAFDKEAQTDTICLGTREYAPPEQYGFSQTDNRTDIYSFGVLLRFILTGGTKPCDIHNKRLDRIVKKCTSLAPEGRYISAQAVKKDLLQALPQAVKRRRTIAVVLALVIVAAVGFGIHKYQEYQERNIWPVDTPAYIPSQDQVNESVDFLNGLYNTDMFSASDDMAGVGYLRDLLVGVYGFDDDYAHALPPDGSIPAENDAYFLPWGLADDDSVHRDILTYVVVKTFWPDLVADWSILKDDTGQYPGVRIAGSFAEENNLLEGMNRFDHLTFGDIAIVYANAQRIYDSAK